MIFGFYSRPAFGRPKPKSFDIAGAYSFPHFLTDLSQNMTLLVEAYVVPHFLTDLSQNLTLIVEAYIFPHFLTDLSQNLTLM